MPAWFIYRQVTPFVDNQRIELEPLMAVLFQLAFEFGDFQGFHQTQRGVEADFIAGINGFQAKADGPVGLTVAGRADEDDVVAVVDKPGVQQTVDFPLAKGGLKAIVELLRAFDSGKTGALAILCDALDIARALS